VSYRLVVREFREPATPVVLIDKVLSDPFFHTPLAPSPTGSYYELEVAAQDPSSRVVGRLVPPHDARSTAPYRFRVQ
jgi:hypothetical protein